MFLAKPMQYETQAIVCLARSPERAARGTNAKRRTAGDNTAERQSSILFLPGNPIIELPGEYRGPNSRLIIIAYGDAMSKLLEENGGGPGNLWGMGRGTPYPRSPARRPRVACPRPHGHPDRPGHAAESGKAPTIIGDRPTVRRP
jgi:hypothetical protein